MDTYALIATVLWTGFFICVIAVPVAALAMRHGHRSTALVILLAASLGLLVFSGIAGFSIGRLTALLPMLVIGYMAGLGRGRWFVLGGLLTAVLAYLAFSWYLTPLASLGGWFDAVFGSWGILAYFPLAVLVFAAAMATDPSTARRPA